jgi:hypothetical protein
MRGRGEACISPIPGPLSPLHHNHGGSFNLKYA